jgi:hypothetical protein
MMLTADPRLPRYGVPAYRALGGIFDSVSKALRDAGRAVSGAISDIGDEARRTWDRVRNEARRAGNRVGDAVERAVKDIGNRDWWVDTVARTVSRVVATKLLVAIASFVYPPVALVAAAIQAFLAKYKAEDVGTPEFWAVADKDGVNEFLADVVVEVNKVDFLQTLPTLALSELTVQAQDSRERRDDLRLRVAEAQARWASAEWAVIAKAAYQAAQAIVISVVTLGAGTVLVAGMKVAVSAIVALGQQMISAATAALQMQQMRELVKAAKQQQRERAAAAQAALNEEMKRLEAEIAAINAEIAAIGGAPVAGGTIADASEAEGTAVSAGGVPTGLIAAALLAGGALAYASSGTRGGRT